MRGKLSFAGSGKGLREQSKPPTLRNFLFGLLAIGMVCLGMIQVRRMIWLDATLLVGGGLAIWLWRGDTPIGSRMPLVGVSTMIWKRGWIGGALLLAAAGITVWRWIRLNVAMPNDADWLWYLASLGMVVLAAVMMQAWGGRSLHEWRIGWTGWTLIAIVAIGAMARLIVLESLPFGTWYDEAANGLEALRIARETAYRPIYTDGVNATGHYLWLIVGAFRVFGENTVAVRSISAVMGILTVVSAYLAGREMFGRNYGLVAAALVAVSRWAITFSRLGMYNTATPLFELLTLFFLLRGLRRGTTSDFMLAGLAMGLGLCFYPAFQLFLAVLGVLLLLIVWREHAQWRNIVIGFAVCTLTAAIVLAPLAKYILERPDSYFARVQTTSLLAGKTPQEQIPALWENTRKHLLMFNVRGDPNGRHNLPGEPMLDWMSGGLFLVGLVMCLRRGLSPRYFLLPTWIVIGLLGGILSLDFEAPQALRAIGAQPAVLLCAALPPAALIREWRIGGGRAYPRFGFWIIFVVLLIPAGVSNFHTYFVRQAHDFAAWNAHSTPETIAAHLLREADPAVEKYVISLYDGHPTVRFLARGVSYRRVETNATLPILREMPQGMLLIVDAERRDLYADARQLYPNAAFQEIQPPFGGPVVVYVNHLTSEDLHRVQGLAGTYTQTSTGQIAPTRVQTLDLMWPDAAPVSMPYSAEWQGVLAVNTFGPYQFYLEAPGKATLWIGETQVISGDVGAAEGLGGGLMLARGNHAIRLYAEGGDGPVRLAWQPPDGPPATIPSWALYVPPVASNGLLGTYYPNGNWEGEPAFAQIDPRLSIYFHVPTLPRPYTVEWRGKIAIPDAGRYEFAIQSNDESTLEIAGEPLTASRVRNEMGIAEVMLEAGLHDIVVRYADRSDHTYINLLWRPPGGDLSFQPVPSGLLFPPQQNYDRVDVDNLARFVQSAAPPTTDVARGTVDPAQVEVVADGLDQPRGIAVGDGVVYVAESGRQRVLAFDSRSGDEMLTPFADMALVEPFDLSVDPQGRVWMLDAGAGQLLGYDPALGTISPVQIVQQYAERSRGIGAGGADEIWIANTAGQRVVGIGADGSILHEIILPAVTGDDNEMQPVDVALMPDDTLFVTDVSGNMLYRFGRAGFLIASQPIPAANSLDSAHLAVDVLGALYMTEPESGRVVKMDADGVVQRVWSLRSQELPNVKPVGIDVEADGTIWVADSQGGRLLRVIPLEEPAE